MHDSVGELEARVRRVPAILREVLTIAPPPGLRPLGATSVVLTGIGSSEAVIRSIEPWFRHQLGLQVSELPLSAFISDDVSKQGKTLVLLSQELSPNATLALARAREFQQALLITSLSSRDPRLDAFRAGGGLVWTLPPSQERELLVRMEGPIAAAFALARLGTKSSAHLAEVPAAVEAAQAQGFALAKSWPLELQRAPMLAIGWYAHCLELIAWTWMEAWWTEPPPVFDVLQLAHGPWQQRYSRAGPWVCFTRPDDAPGLWACLERMLPSHQSLIRVNAKLPGVLAMFEHLGFVQGLLSGVLLRSPRDLTQWPGKNTDGPLYELGSAAATPPQREDDEEEERAVGAGHATAAASDDGSRL